MEKTDLQQLTAFLGEANRAGYASGRNDLWQKLPNGSTDIVFEKGPWLFNDNYFGGEPFGGREVIFFDQQPVFLMVYYGRLSGPDLDADTVYAFMRRALQAFPADHPFRGPREWAEMVDGRELRYENGWQGEIDDFSGEEKIFLDGQQVYAARYAGGLICER